MNRTFCAAGVVAIGFAAFGAAGQMTTFSAGSSVATNAGWNTGPMWASDSQIDSDSWTSGDGGAQIGATASSCLWAYGVCSDGTGGGKSNATTWSIGGEGESMFLGMTSRVEADYDGSDGPVNGFAEAETTASRSVLLTFRRTAWYWFDWTSVIVGDRPPFWGSIHLGINDYNTGDPGWLFMQTGTFEGDLLGAVASESTQGSASVEIESGMYARSNGIPNDDIPVYEDGTMAMTARLCVVECLADWDRSHAVNTIDFITFGNDWAAGAADADLNGDGNVNTIDYTIFLNAWSAGDCVSPCN